MRSRFNSLLTISLMLFLTSCTRLLFDDEELSMKRTNYIGEELMTDGYYITGENLGITFFLYKNGVFLQGFAFDMMEKTEVENSYKNGDFYNSIKDNKLHWGLFRVSSNEIIIEGWQPTGGGSFSTYSLKGEIPNDTTIHIMQKWSHGKKEAYNEIYHFKQFNPKPDSTNSFIK